MKRLTFTQSVMTSLMALALVACGQDKPTDGEPTKLGSAQTPSDRTGLDGEVSADGGDTPESEEDMYAGFDPRVARAARVANRIEADPTRADEALEELGMDRAQLDSLMYEIAREPELTGEYRIARGLDTPAG